MALTTKQLVLLGSGVATIGGGTIGTYYFLQEKTIKDRLVNSGQELAEGDKDYEDIFKALKDQEELTTAISTTDKKIINTTPDAEAREALKGWCNKTLEKNLSDEGADALIEKAKKYCTKAPLTIGEKINKSSKKLVSDWRTRLDSIKNPPSKDTGLLEALKAIDAEVTEFTEPKITKAVAALKTWCTKKQETKLNEDTENKIWKEVEGRCLENRT